MRRIMLLAVPLVVVLAGATFGAPAPARAAVCADYPDQAAAQRAADTRDGDGDGVYCEDLPCPCLRAGHRGGTGARPRRLGPSVALGPVRRTTGCRVRGPLPDRACTPGARFEYVTRARVCRPGYARSVRNVSSATRDTVYRAYGIARRFDGATGELDHLVSLELGGSNARANLFPEAAAPRAGSHQKDRLENALHAEVCSGQISLRRAQRLIAGDWVAAYQARFA